MAHQYSADVANNQGIDVVRLSGPDGSYAEIAPGLGNNCFVFNAPDPVLEAVDFASFLEKPTSYGIPILFPFPNRIRDGQFEYNGAEFHVDPPRHGFVRDKAWTVDETGASESEGAFVRASLRSSDYPERILAQFPFPFSIEVTWRLRERTLTMETVVRNTGDAVFPYGFGIHPYFQRSNTATVTVPAAGRWELDESLPTGRILDVEPPFDLREGTPVAGLSLDDIYTRPLSLPDSPFECWIDDPQANQRTVIEFDPAAFPHIVVFTPPTPRPSICIEPLTCPTDAYNLRTRGIEAGVRELEPGAHARFAIRFRRESVGNV